MPKHDDHFTFYKWIAACFVAVGLFFLVIAFLSGHVTPIQYRILVWFVGPITALVAGAFTGQLVVKESKVAKAVVTATGGFGVWLLFFLLIPLPNEASVTLLLFRSGQPVREARSVTIEFADDRRTETAIDGKAVFRVPSDIDQIDAIRVEGEFVEGGSDTPRPIKSNESIRVSLSSANPDDKPTAKPTQLPDPEAFAALRPSENDALRIDPNRVPGSKVQLSYQNLSDTSLDLYVLDCWAFYTKNEPLWRIWKLPARGETKDFDSFDDHMTGYFCFGIRKMNTTGTFIPLRCEQLFDTANPMLTISGTYPHINLSLKKQP